MVLANREPSLRMSTPAQPVPPFGDLECRLSTAVEVASARDQAAWTTSACGGLALALRPGNPALRFPFAQRLPDHEAKRSQATGEN